MYIFSILYMYGKVVVLIETTTFNFTFTFIGEGR